MTMLARFMVAFAGFALSLLVSAASAESSEDGGQMGEGGDVSQGVMLGGEMGEVGSVVAIRTVGEAGYGVAARSRPRNTHSDLLGIAGAGGERSVSGSHAEWAAASNHEIWVPTSERGRIESAATESPGVGPLRASEQPTHGCDVSPALSSGSHLPIVLALLSLWRQHRPRRREGLASKG